MIHHYLIRGGLQGRERLRLLSRVMQPSSVALLARAGLRAGVSCLDVGCGGGDLTCDMARLVGPSGRVVGVDIDRPQLSIAAEEARAAGLENIEFHHLDIMQTSPADTFDFIHARFLLTHMPDPGVALAHMVGALKSGGMLVLQDIDMEGQFCFPPVPEMDSFKALYTRIAERRGVDAHIGRRLPALMGAAGLDDIQVNVVQPAGTRGDVKLIAPITMENIAEAAIDEGLATHAELEAIKNALYGLVTDPSVLVSLPRIVEVWATRASAA